MARPSSLRCRVCAHEPTDERVQYCEECFGPLDLILGAPPARGEDLRARIEAGPASMWRYRDLLPFDEPPGADDVGWTPLRQAGALGAAIGLDRLWLKDESANPTGSFKDRVVAAALGHGLLAGPRIVACASTGNLALAVARGARGAGTAAVVLVSEALPEAEQQAVAAAGAVVVPVAADYDAANRLASEASMDPAGEAWAWVNIGLRPWYVEGSATVAHEIAEALDWRAPDVVVAPMASGAFALALHRAFADLAQVGLLASSPPPALWVVEPAGCAPVAAAFAAAVDDVRPVRPDTSVASLAMGDPPDGPEVLAAARASGGGVIAVPEGEVGEATALVADRGGVSTEAAGGVVVAGARALAADGRVPAEATVVACLTGGPHDRWASHQALGQGPPGRVAGTIQPTVSALVAAVAEGLSPQEDPNP